MSGNGYLSHRENPEIGVDKVQQSANGGLTDTVLSPCREENMGLYVHGNH